MSVSRKRIVTIVASLGGAAFTLLAIMPLFIRNMSPITAGMIEGAVAVVCLVGVGFGVWDAKRLEAKRKAKEDIWVKH